MSYDLYKFFGLQRSGNHAVINWLVGLDQQGFIFFNNVDWKKPISESVSAVSLPPGIKAYASRESKKSPPVIKHEYINNLSLIEGGKLLFSYENMNMSSYVDKRINRNIVASFGSPISKTNILIVRNIFNMLPSAARMVRRQQAQKRRSDEWFVEVMRKRVEMWKSYAFLAVEASSFSRGEFIPILFDKWVVDKSYRDSLAEVFGLLNKDKNIDFVSDAGNGSSFSGIKGVEQKGVVNRWVDGDDVNALTGLLKKNLDAVDLNVKLFGKESVPKGFYK